MFALNVFDEMITKHEEHLEMIEVEDTSVAMIQILCNMVQKEREEKEFYKKMYKQHRCVPKGCNT